VGWSMRPDMQRDLVIDALEMARFKRNPVKAVGSRMTRECHVRFCERLRAKFPGSTYPRSVPMKISPTIKITFVDVFADVEASVGHPDRLR
jgi:hypothetical protein